MGGDLTPDTNVSVLLCVEVQSGTFSHFCFGTLEILMCTFLIYP